MGASTAATLIANALVPALLDRYLARTGLAAQQTGEPRPPGTPDNLFAPLDGGRDFGAHGRFDDRARARSTQQWAARHLGALATALRRRRSRHGPDRVTSVIRVGPARRGPRPSG